MDESKIRMSNYILAIIKSYKYEMFSWGFSRPVATKNHLELCFFVNGFKHQGYVRVKYLPEKDLFNIVFLDIFKREISRFEKVAFECIVEIINREVGRTEDYLEKIRMN